jgi:hypothetical protein
MTVRAAVLALSINLIASLAIVGFAFLAEPVDASGLKPGAPFWLCLKPAGCH